MTAVHRVYVDATVRPLYHTPSTGPVVCHTYSIAQVRCNGPRVRYNRPQVRCNGLQVWNTIPSDITYTSSIQIFIKLLRKRFHMLIIMFYICKCMYVRMIMYLCMYYMNECVITLFMLCF